MPSPAGRRLLLVAWLLPAGVWLAFLLLVYLNPAFGGVEHLAVYMVYALSFLGLTGTHAVGALCAVLAWAANGGRAIRLAAVSALLANLAAPTLLWWRLTHSPLP